MVIACQPACGNGLNQASPQLRHKKTARQADAAPVVAAVERQTFPCSDNTLSPVPWIQQPPPSLRYRGTLNWDEEPLLSAARVFLCLALLKLPAFSTVG